MVEVNPDTYKQLTKNQRYGHSDGMYLDKTNGIAVAVVDGVPVVAGVAGPPSVLVCDEVSAELIGNAARWSMRIQEPCGIDTDAFSQGQAGCTAAADLVGVEVAIGYLKQWDNSASKFYNVEAASAGDHVIHQLVPNNVQTADYILVGNAVPFMQARFDMNIVQTYTGDATAWKYWNGTAWAALTTINENSDAADADGDRSFGQDGGPFFVPPAAWAASTIDGVTGYWLKVELTDASKINVKGTMNSHRHTITQPGAPFQVPMDCKITAVTLRDEATTVHTATDIKCVLMNITKGANTREMVFPQDQRTAVFTPFTMSCDSGDVLSLFVTQEDGTNEMGPLTIEIAADIPKQ